MEQIAVTIQICGQIGPEDYKMYNHTKLFDKSTTIEQIELWIKTYGKSLTILDASLSKVDK